MKKLAFFLACAVTLPTIAQTYVNPHVRKDGTYVDGHYRSRPNNTVDDNWSTRGNQNPYTGERGTQRPDYEREQRSTYSPPRYDDSNPLNGGRRRGYLD